MSEAETEKPDELTQAIQMAKEHLLKAFKGEKIENLGLEEVESVSHFGIWDITLGFNRPREITHPAPNAFLQAAAAVAAARPPRVYKVVRIDMHHPEAISIKNRKDD